MTVKRREQRRPNMRRAVILFPSGLTLGNLFFGVFAIITASRGDFVRAGVYVVLGAICDALDGRVARATNAGSAFGEELDSLVDAISFGFAPAMIMYFAVLNRDGWDWTFVFLFVAAAVLRLARFNVEQAGTAKTYFQGLPSPAAGMTLASYYWFSQSWLYDYAAVGNLPWTELLRFLMVVLALLMISPIPYPVFPRTGFKSLRTLAGTVLLVGSFTLFVTKKLEFFFPMSLIYVALGPIRWAFSNLFERRQPTIAYDLSEGEEDEEEEIVVLPPPSRNRELRASREERTKLKRTQGDRDIAAPVEVEPRERAARGDRPDRAARPDRPDRPERTEAERAARREKREKRDKREGRPPRTPRADRPADSAASSGVDAIGSSDEAITDAGNDEELIGLIPGGAEDVATSGEGTAARKRKRRRRRGERKGRGGAEGGAEGGAAGESDAGGSDDAGGDDRSDGDEEGGSPYASSAPVPVTPPPIPQSPPPIPSTPPPIPSSAPESSE